MIPEITLSELIARLTAFARETAGPIADQVVVITDRDRFLDDASDRRAALMAASRVLANEDHVSHDEVAAVSAALYQHLRKGKSDA